MSHFKLQGADFRSSPVGLFDWAQLETIFMLLRKGVSASDSWRRLQLLLLGKVSLVGDVPEAGELVTVVVVCLMWSDVGGVEGWGGGTLMQRGVTGKLFSALTRPSTVFSPCCGSRRGVPPVTFVCSKVPVLVRR